MSDVDMRDSGAAGEQGAMIACRCVVAGRVQGVYYRKTVQQRARELGVSGHARNLADGRVEVELWGASGAVEQLVQFLWVGSTMSAVTAVEVVAIETQTTQRPPYFSTA
jgi:acylphosphatase